MNDFVFYSPAESISEKEGVTDQVGEHIAKRGYKRALLVYGKGVPWYAGNARPCEEVARGVGRRDFVELCGRASES